MTTQEKLNHAVLYALREGCFFPVPEPKPSDSTQAWIQWGAMRYLHDAIAEFYPVAPVPSEEAEQ
jgi:hypothetical protein